MQLQPICLSARQNVRKWLPSGRQAIFDNRVGWTRTYLKKAGLLTTPSRGTYQLTQLGKQVLDSNPTVIDNSFLEQFDSFHQFIHAEPAPVNCLTDGQTGRLHRMHLILPISRSITP